MKVILNIYTSNNTKKQLVKAETARNGRRKSRNTEILGAFNISLSQRQVKYAENR